MTTPLIPFSIGEQEFCSLNSTTLCAFEKRFLSTRLPEGGGGGALAKRGWLERWSTSEECEREDRWSDDGSISISVYRCIWRCETAILNLTARVATTRRECDAAREQPLRRRPPFFFWAASYARRRGLADSVRFCGLLRTRCAPCSPSKTANTRSRPLASVCSRQLYSRKIFVYFLSSAIPCKRRVRGRVFEGVAQNTRFSIRAPSLHPFFWGSAFSLHAVANRPRFIEFLHPSAWKELRSGSVFKYSGLTRAKQI